MMATIMANNTNISEGENHPPWIDMHASQLKLLHDILQRRHPTSDMLRLIRKCFEEAGLILFSVKPDNECFKRESSDPSR